MTRQQGQTIVEYGIAIGFIALVVVGALILLGGGVEGAFRDTSDALTGEESGIEATPTPEPTPTPNRFTSICRQELALSSRKNTKFRCIMDERIQNIEEVGQVTISVNPTPPDFHVVLIRFPRQGVVTFFCGPGGCRGFGGPKNYLYPYSDISDTLPDEWKEYSRLFSWRKKEIKGRASYYRLKGDGKTPGPWMLTTPEIPWTGELQIKVVGKSPDTQLEPELVKPRDAKR